MAVANLRVMSDSIIKPHSSPSSGPHPYLNTLAPLTVFDLAMPTVQMPLIYVFRDPLPDNQTLITGLAKALFYYPHLAGSFTTDRGGHPCIRLDDAGVRVIETTVGTGLGEHLPLDTSMDLSNLLPPLDGIEMAQFQINRFACGGLVLGFTIHHLVGDACSFSSFMNAWALMVNGFELQPLPYHDRSSLAVPPNPPCEFSTIPCMPDFSPLIVNLSVHFSKDFLANLKASVNAGSNGHQQLSTYQCLATHMWKKISLARKLDGDMLTRLDMNVNGRKWVKPAMPKEYFGNLVLTASVKMNVKDLLSKSYADVACEIRRAILEVGELEQSAAVVQYTLERTSLSPDMLNSSVMGLGFEEVRFGDSRPCSLLLPCLHRDGVTVFLPSCEGGGGGVNVCMALEKETAFLFRQVSHSFDAARKTSTSGLPNKVESSP